jgi:hypothetical protein
MTNVMFWGRFGAAILLLGAFVYTTMHDAKANGWFWPLSQSAKKLFANQLFPGTTHYFEVWSHWGYRASIPLAFFLAWAFAESSPRWNSQATFVVVLLSSLLAVFAMRSWAIGDNHPEAAKHVLSGFAQNGNLTIPGLCMTFSMAFTYAIAAMYFVTPGPTDTLFPLIFAIVLTIALVVGLLQPPLYVWGYIHGAAWAQSAFFTVLVWGLYFAHKFGYTISA